MLQEELVVWVITSDSQVVSIFSPTKFLHARKEPPRTFSQIDCCAPWNLRKKNVLLKAKTVSGSVDSMMVEDSRRLSDLKGLVVASFSPSTGEEYVT